MGIRRAPWVVLCAAVTLAQVPAARAQDTKQAAPSASRKGTGDRDRKAKALFAAGRYAEAIDLLAQLYADTGSPAYLRNIGRCHQRLKDPDKAIASFEEYLLRGKDITPAERDEVRGFIEEMEALKKKTGAAPVPAGPPTSSPPSAAAGAPPGAATPLPPTAAAPSPVSAPPPSAAVPFPAATPVSAGPMPSAPPSAAPPASPAGSIAVAADAGVGRGMSGGRIAGIVAMAVAGAMAVGGTVVLVSSRAKFNSAKKSPCPGVVQDCNDAADQVQRLNLVSQVLYAGAAVAGATGGVVFLLSAPAPSERASAPAAGLVLAAQGRF